VTQQLDYTFFKTKSAPTTTITSNFRSLKCIPSFSIGSHLHQNPKTNSMSPERIRLFFTNFPLVSVFQHNANSIAIFRYSATLFPSIQLPRHSIDFFASPLTVTSRSTNQLPRSPYKNHDIPFSHFILAMILEKC